MIGRSQGQYANAIRGHDPISGAAVNRLREILLQNRRQNEVIGAQEYAREKQAVTKG